MQQKQGPKKTLDTLFCAWYHKIREINPEQKRKLAMPEIEIDAILNDAETGQPDDAMDSFYIVDAEFDAE